MQRSPATILRLVVGIGWLGLLSSCGYVGDPQPPALNTPLPIADLRAAEYGDKIVFEFTAIASTVDGLTLSRLHGGEIEIRGPRTSAYPIALEKPGPGRYELPVAPWIGEEVIVAVRAFGPKGRGSNWSNTVRLRIIAPLSAPDNVRADSAPQGVKLSWSSRASRFRVFRDRQLLGGSETPEYADTTAEFGKSYEYMVQSLGEDDTQQSEISAPVRITPADSYAPAAPTGLTALVGTGSIELAWERNTEPDFRAYRVYRSVDGGEFARIGEEVETPAYSDRSVEPGKRYRYTITSVDQSGNESPRSAVVEPGG